MTDRGERRAQKERNKKRWHRNVMATWVRPGGDMSWAARLINKMSNHGKLCSCIACGNKRKSEGPSLQERRADQPGAEHE